MHLNRFTAFSIIAYCILCAYTLQYYYYRATHYSAKRGLLHVVVCLSVRPSVTLVDQDHIGRKSRKLIARTISATPLLFVVQRPFTYSQGNMGTFWGDYRWGGKKWPAGVQKWQYL